MLFLIVSGKAQPPLLPNFEYIETYSFTAVEQMLTYRIPASVTMAQAILESRCGTSNLARRSNNHFGIKCHYEWGGDTIHQNDDTLSECFRSYANISESYTDHSLFLRSRPRYAALFDLPITDYKAWCNGLKACGYATFPNYAEVLIGIIENYALYQLDQVETLPPRSLQFKPINDLKPSALNPAEAGVLRFAEVKLLFADEFDIHLRSLLHAVHKH